MDFNIEEPASSPVEARKTKGLSIFSSAVKSASSKVTNTVQQASTKVQLASTKVQQAATSSVQKAQSSLEETKQRIKSLSAARSRSKERYDGPPVPHPPLAEHGPSLHDDVKEAVNTPIPVDDAENDTHDVLHKKPATETGGGDGVAFESAAAMMTDSERASAENKQRAKSILMIPIDFGEAATIYGTDSQIVTVSIRPGNRLRAELGSMIYTSSSIEMHTIPPPSPSGGLLGRMVGSASTGWISNVIEYSINNSCTTNSPASPTASATVASLAATATDPVAATRTEVDQQQEQPSEENKEEEDGEEEENIVIGTVTLGSNMPGSKILRINLEEHGHMLAYQKGTFLCCSAVTIDADKTTTKVYKPPTGSLFGGSSHAEIPVQGIKGTGDVFLQACGYIIQKTLIAGERIIISPGSLIAFTKDVTFDLQIVKGFTNVCAGNLTGPGSVWLAGLPNHPMSELLRDKH